MIENLLYPIYNQKEKLDLRDHITDLKYGEEPNIIIG
jgi:hypothetical protein